MILDRKHIEAELERLFKQAYEARVDTDATQSRRDFDDGRSFAYGQALALLRGEDVR
jgi:hypothetical protein